MIDVVWHGVRKADEKLMERCVRFAHWFQRLTGHTSFFIAKIGVSLCAWSLFAEIVNYWHPLLDWETSLVSVVFKSWCVLFIVYISINCNKSEERLYDGRVVLPAWVIDMRASETTAWRFVWFCLIVLTAGRLFYDFVHLPHTWEFVFAKLVYAGFAPGMMIFSYFIHVDPLPPGTSKFRQWVEGFGFGPKTVQSEN